MIPIAKPFIGDDEISAITNVLKSGRLVQGPNVEKFESLVANICNVKHAIAVSNGTVALDLALKSLDIKSGDEIITTPFTFVATINSILQQGATPVFVDIDLDSFNISANLIEKKITNKTKVIIPVDLYGQTYDYDEVSIIAKNNNLSIIEDSAQAIGASYKDKMAGSLGDCGTFSFYATKNITTGEGGMIVTNSDKISSKIKILRNQGQDPDQKYNYTMMGYNARLTDMQAVIGVEQLKKLKEINNKRVVNANFFDNKFKDIKWLKTPKRLKDRSHVFHQYTIILDEKINRESFVSHLKNNDVGYGIYYPKPLYDYPHLKKYKSVCKNADMVAKSVVSLPIHPNLSDSDLNKIVKVVLSYPN